MFLGVQQKIQAEIERLENSKTFLKLLFGGGIINAQIMAYKKCLEFIEEEVLNSEELAHLSQAAKLLEEKR